MMMNELINLNWNNVFNLTRALPKNTQLTHSFSTNMRVVQVKIMRTSIIRGFIIADQVK